MAQGSYARGGGEPGTPCGEGAATPWCSRPNSHSRLVLGETGGPTSVQPGDGFGVGPLVSPRTGRLRPRGPALHPQAAPGQGASRSQHPAHARQVVVNRHGRAVALLWWQSIPSPDSSHRLPTPSFPLRS